MWALIFSQISQYDLDEIYYAVMNSWFVEAHAKFVSHDQLSWERTIGDFIRPTLDTGLCLKAYEALSFKLVMIAMTELSSLIPVWMTLAITQDHRTTRKLKPVQSFC